MKDHLVTIEDLSVNFYTYKGTVKALDGVNLEIRRREWLGLVGETGCGKSMTALSILNLVPRPGRIISGRIFFDKDGDLLKKTDREMMKIRGEKISMIFQDPSSSLNPVSKVGSQIAETLTHHRGMTGAAALLKATDLLEMVGIPEAEKRRNDYPHLLSGGMKQRVMIAMALACNPKLLIADEPTTNLDVTTQAQILRLLREVGEKIGSSVLLITHNLGVVAENCDRICVMYAGQVVEVTETATLFEDPLHPYTKGLLGSVPKITEKKEWLPSIPGTVPSLVNPPEGCRFRDRCPISCAGSEVKPPLIEVKAGHLVACHEVKKR